MTQPNVLSPLLNAQVSSSDPSPISTRADITEQALQQILYLLTQHHYRHTTISPASHATIMQRDWQHDSQQHSTLMVLQQLFGWSRAVPISAIPADLYQLGQQAQLWQMVDHAQVQSRLRVSSLDDAGQRYLFWHSAYPTVQADAVFFGPDTYRFVRAIAAWLDQHQPTVQRAVEICSGAGPAAITIAKRYPLATVQALDINPAALQLSRIQAAHVGADRFTAQHSNLLHDVEGQFDLIVANPPYLVDASERAYRHGGGPLGAGLSLAIIEQSLSRLTVGGSLLLYTGVAMINGIDPFWQAIEQMHLDAQQWSIDYQEIDPDVFGEELATGVYAQADRIAAIFLTITRLA